MKERLAGNGMVIQNRGNAPTYVRQQGASRVDLTFTFEDIASEIKKWEFLECEIVSGHKAIKFEIETGQQEVMDRTSYDKWRFVGREEERFREVLRGKKQELQKLEAEEFRREGKKVYWSNNEIAQQRKICVRAIRKWSRTKSRRNTEQGVIEEQQQSYKEERKKFRKMIEEDKKKKWRELIEELENDPWGEAYKIVNKRIGRARPETLKETEENRVMRNTAIGFCEVTEFEAVVRNWREEEKATSLIAGLRGEALEVLRTIPEGRQDYKAVTSALEKRYGNAHLQHVYQAQLRNRKQRFEETLQQYEADVSRMVNLAYWPIQQLLLSQLIRLARHKTISEALAQALEIEAAKQASRGTSKFRQVKAYHGKDWMETANGNLADIIIEVVEKYKKGQDSENSTMNRRRPIRCWICGVEAHMKSRCPQPPTEQNQGNAI
ncbi:hypothetical protein NQ315_003553 [Exocentrus adspersus]|uniref:CCHC-type domain-containing protein n=1 Tax=Exocentrus adspersus TaxID=1586481 RepID=A0AAV8VCH9_9CUCU|nr:hypothetical protein NQ315_003553 [Exocentrus adspersus]